MKVVITHSTDEDKTNYPNIWVKAYVIPIIP